jgi:hemolysin activation/secretion protein
VLRVSVAIALSVADTAAGTGFAAVTAPSAALPPGAPTPGEIQSNLPTAPQTPNPKSAPLTSAPPPVSTEVPSGGPTVTVTGFDISGNTVFDDATLQALVADYIGKDLTLAGLYNAAAVITRYYQDHGYGIARATVPQQALEGGRIKLQVLEGRIGAVHVEGNSHTRTGAILRQGSAVKGGDVYTDAAMERAALLVNDLPGLQSQAVLSPGTEFGTSDIAYKITEEPAYSGQLSVDDYGRPDIGRVRISGEVNVASPTGSGDRLSATVLHSEHDLLDFGALTYNLPVGSGGGRVTASYDQSRYHVTGAFSALHLAGSGKDGSLSYLYPQRRSRYSSFYWGFGFQHESGVTTITVPETVTDPVTHKVVSREETVEVAASNLNVLQLTAFYSHGFDDNSDYYVSGSLSSNGRHDDGNDSRAERAKLEVDAGYQLPFGQSWTFVTRGSSVWSPDPLSDTEKFSLGGPDNLRGYPSADVRGDAGFYGSLELQRSFAPELPVALGAFFDAGRVWSRHFDTPFTGTDPLTGQQVSGVSTTPPEVHTLESVGAELIYQSSDKRWESRLEWAYAVGYAKPSDGNTGGHIWATFGMNF